MTFGTKFLNARQPSIAVSDKVPTSTAKSEPSDDEIGDLLNVCEPGIREAATQPDAGLFLLRDMLFAHLSPEVVRLLGYSSERLLGRLGPLEIVSNEDWERLSAYLEDSLKDDASTVAATFKFTRGDGSPIDCDLLCQKCEYSGEPWLVGVIKRHSDKPKPVTYPQALKSISQIIAGEDPFDRKLDLLCTEIAQLFQCLTLTVWQPKQNKPCVLRCTYDFIDDEKSPCLHLLRKVNQQRLERDITACLPAGHFFIGEAAQGKLVEVDRGVSFVSIPLPFGNTPAGVLAFTRREPLTAENKIWLELCANHLGAFVHSHETEEALQRSQELYSKLFIHSRDAIFLHDLQGQIIDANPRALKMLGYTKGELLALNVTNLHPTEALRDSSQAFETIAREGSVSFEITFKRKEGTTFPAEVSSSLFEIDGKPIIQGIVRDISERHKVETALRHAEHEKALILDSISELVTFQDASLTVKWANKSAGKSVNADPAELVGRKCYEIWHQREKPCEDCPVIASLREGVPKEAEIKTPDGRIWLIKGSPVRDAKGKIIGVVEITLEITDRKREEEARQQREAELKIQNQIASAFLTSDDDSAYAQVLQVVMDATESRHGIFGYIDEEGQFVFPAKSNIFDVARDNDQATAEIELWPAVWREALASGKTVIMNQGVDSPQWPLAIDRSLFVPIVDNQKAIGVLIVANKATDYTPADVTLLEVTAKRIAPILKARLAKAREERRRLQAQCEKEKMQQNLLKAQKMEAIGKLASGIAHDFNNILAAIEGFCDLIMMRVEADSAIYRDLQQIKAASTRGNNLIKQLLLFSRSQQLQMSPFNINEIVEGIAQMVSRLLGEHISLTVCLDPEIWTTRGDQSQIEQMIMNLVVNARDAMPSGGNITITTENVVLEDKLSDTAIPGKYVCLSVADEGDGIEPASLDHIFDPFYTTKDKGRGTGLGLSVVHGIVERHGGWIDVETQLGKGTKFKVFLPAQGNLDGMSSSDKADFADLRGNGEGVLVIEDEEPVRSLIKRALSENNYVVYEAASSEEALRMLEKHEDEIQLVISDVVLTDANGIDVVEKMLSKKSDLRILMTSGYANGKSQLERIRNHDFRFIPKPFELKELFRSVKAALG